MVPTEKPLNQGALESCWVWMEECLFVSKYDTMCVCWMGGVALMSALKGFCQTWWPQMGAVLCCADDERDARALLNARNGKRQRWGRGWDGMSPGARRRQRSLI